MERLPEDQQKLEKAGRELAQVWLRFQECVPDGFKSNVADRPPKILDVLKAVDLAQSKWKTSREAGKTGRLRKGFGKLCSSLDDYKALLAVVPSSDKYFCILTGSLSAIVKVRESYIRCAFSRFIELFSSLLPTCFRAICILYSYSFRDNDVLAILPLDLVSVKDKSLSQ